MSVNDIRKYIGPFILSALSNRGQTIPQLEGQIKRHIADNPVLPYYDLPVWHRRQDLIVFVASELKLNKKYWGPQRTSADFYNAVDQEIAKLRRKKIIVDWQDTKRIGIFRLESPGTPVQKPAVMTDILKIKPSSNQSFNDSLKKTFVSIITQGRKDNTYKFALARALLEHCRDTRFDNEAALVVSYDYLAEKFLQYYWNQECRFKIKQDFKTKSTPKVISAIRKVFTDPQPVDFTHASQDKKVRVQKDILKKVFGNEKSKTSLVVPRFQKIKVGRYSELNDVFYDYDDNKKFLTLRPKAFEFLRNNNAILSMAVLCEWSKFLERINGSLPRLVAKIDNQRIKRTSLSKYMNAYMHHTDHCFYCCTRLERGYIDVDHFLPWSYIFEDEAWNLVLACRECNSKKSNSLAQTEFQHELIRRNTTYRNRIRLLDHSLQIIDTKRGWETEIQHHYNVCQEYGFNTKNMP